MFERTANDGVARLCQAHGKVNALDVELLQALTLVLRAEATTAERALVLTACGGPALEAVAKQEAAFRQQALAAWRSPEVHTAIWRRLDALKGPR